MFCHHLTAFSKRSSKENNIAGYMLQYLRTPRLLSSSSACHGDEHAALDVHANSLSTMDAQDRAKWPKNRMKVNPGP